MKDFIQYISEYKNTQPDSVFIKSGKHLYTYKDVSKIVNSLSLNIKNGRNKGRNIGLLLKDSPEFLFAFFSIIKNSDIAILLPSNSSPEIITSLLDKNKFDTIIYNEEYRNIIESNKSIKFDKVKKIIVGNPIDDEINFDDLYISTNSSSQNTYISIDIPAVLLYSSGVSGNPKGIIFDHQAIISNAISCWEIIGSKLKLSLLGYPNFSNYISLILVIGVALISGGTIIIPENKSPESLLKTIDEEKPEVFVGVSKILNQLVNNKNHKILNILKYALAVGNTLSLDFIEKWESTYSSPLLEGYGLTEGLIVSFNKPGLWKKDYSFGVGLSKYEMKVVDENEIEVESGQTGELFIKGPCLFSEYQNSQNPFLHECWFPTGDLVSRDVNGFYFYKGRKNNKINRYGFSICSQEIEKVILQHPKVKKVKVLKLIGEKFDNMKICIVPKDDIEINIEEIKSFARTNLPKFLQPDFVQLFDEFPEDELGKMNRNILIQKL